MATITIDVDTGGAGAYSSLNAAEAGAKVTYDDLVGDGNIIEFVCRASTDVADTTTVLFDGWTTGASNYIVIKAASGEQAIKSGWSDTIYRLTTTSGTVAPLGINEAYTRVEGLQVKITSTNYSGRGIIQYGASNIRIDGCRLRLVSSGNNVAVSAIDDQGVGYTCTTRNTIIEGDHTGGNGGIFSASGSNNVTAYNCVIYGFGVGYRSYGGTIKNCAVFNNNDDFINGTIDYCASDDGDGTNAVAAPTWANEFEDAAAGDFTLKTGGDLEDAGVGPGTDGSVPTTDIDGTTRSGTTCDIGPDEIAAAAVSPPPSRYRVWNRHHVRR